MKTTNLINATEDPWCKSNKSSDVQGRFAVCAPMTMATKVGKHSITRQMMDQTFHRQTTIILHHFNNAFSTETLYAHSQGK
jgi:hypothetical protein